LEERRVGRRQRSYREILATTRRLRNTYASGGNISRNITINQRITNAGRSATQNLARNLRVDVSLLSYPNFRDRRGFTTTAKGLSNG